jgi:hypothetical protein
MVKQAPAKGEAKQDGIVSRPFQLHNSAMLIVFSCLI